LKIDLLKRKDIYLLSRKFVFQERKNTVRAQKSFSPCSQSIFVDNCNYLRATVNHKGGA